MNNLFNQPEIVRHSNNSESAATNMRDMKGLNNQCEITFLALKTENLTNKDGMAMNKYHIGDLRRRCKDLIDIFGIPVYSRFLPNSRFKEYSLTPFKTVYTT